MGYPHKSGLSPQVQTTNPNQPAWETWDADRDRDSLSARSLNLGATLQQSGLRKNTVCNLWCLAVKIHVLFCLNLSSYMKTCRKSQLGWARHLNLNLIIVKLHQNHIPNHVCATGAARLSGCLKTGYISTTSQYLRENYAYPQIKHQILRSPIFRQTHIW